MKAKKRGAQTVTIYTTQDCPWCHKAKEFFKENHIRFEEIDVGKSVRAAKQMIAKSGQQGVPVVEIGKTILVGFDKSALRKALGLKKKGFRLW